MRAIDTNVLVRLIVRDDPKQLAIAEAFTAAEAWISLLVLAETTWVLSSVYGRNQIEIADGLEVILDQKNFAIQDSETVAAAIKHFRARLNLDFSDCLILELARKAGHLPLGTFDRDLAKLEGTQKL